MDATKKGRPPGILWRTPIYVTELVGYLYRRRPGDLVRVSDKIFLGPVTESPITSAARRPAHRRQRLLCRAPRCRCSRCGIRACARWPRREMPARRRRSIFCPIPGRLLSVTQVGVTLASLGLGWAGEDTIYGILVGTVRAVGTRRAPPGILHGFCFFLSFLVDQLLPRGAGRSGAEESGDRQGRPPGRVDRSGAAALLSSHASPSWW